MTCRLSATIRPGRVRVLLIGIIVLCLDATFHPEAWAQAADKQAFKPGETYFGRREFTEYLAGDLPVIIAAPHGGREKPGDIPDRLKGTFAFDTNTQELARAIAAEFHQRTGRHIHVVICRLHRLKVDCNRDAAEATGGHPLAVQAWEDFQGFLDHARVAVTNGFDGGLFIDLHGHGHKEQRLELGYLHTRETLGRTDAELNAAEFVRESSLRAAAERSKTPYPELLRGPRSLGALLEAEGFPSTPSPREPAPSAPYFNGGYNTRRHGRDAGPVCGLQIETNFKGVRDTAESRKRFAAALVKVAETWLKERQGIALPAVEKADGGVD
jgi:hypothetical protein